MLERGVINLRICIDAGHGITTPGKRSPDGTLKEFEFNSYVAYHLAKLLKEYEKVETMFTHSNDRDVKLEDRVKKANNWNADLFISIHANAFGNGSDFNSAHGIETYVYKTKPTKAYEVGLNCQKELLRLTHRENRGIKTSEFYVLKYTKMTAVLVECGFMTNKEECELLKTIEYRELCATALLNAIIKSYNLVKKEEFLTYIVRGNKHKMVKLAEELSERGFEIHSK
jgi:N-acetylmuramoyl-L-alanine amidase